MYSIFINFPLKVDIFMSNLPNVNSSVAKPEAERPATNAEGPGIGITGIFSLTHNFTCPKFQ